MACLLEDVQASLCASEIGKVTDPIQLMQIIAQLLADQVFIANPALDVTLAGIQERACTSGIGKVTDPIELLQLAAQSGCDVSS